MFLVIDRTETQEHNPHNSRPYCCIWMTTLSRRGTMPRCGLSRVRFSFLIQTNGAHVTESRIPASSRELDRAILEAVSEDYQSFEAVVNKLSQASHISYETIEIERVLLSSVADKLVAAYLLHADPPYATEVGAAPDTIQRYWFCITEEGREHLLRLSRKHPVARRNRTH
jgi:hypothetical protein